MKRFFLFTIVSTFIFHSVDAARLTIKEDMIDGFHSLESSPLIFSISTENKKRFVSFNKPLSLDEDILIQSDLPIEFNSELKCKNLSITYLKDAYKIRNNGSIDCINLNAEHQNHLIYFVNKGTCVFRKINENFEKRQINLENFILLNKPNGKIETQFHINFTWDKNLPSERFVYDIQKTPDVARIQNYGVIKGTRNIDLDISVYMSENSLISTDRRYKIRFSNEKLYPVYALTRIPAKYLMSYVKGEILSGQLGEMAAVHYYQNFEKIPSSQITSFKANNSDNGIDLMCVTPQKIVIHECKNYSDSSFSLSLSKKNGKQCSQKWIEGYFEGMKKISEKKQNEYKSTDSLLRELQKSNDNNSKLHKIILKTTKYSDNGKLNKSLPENNLILNGNSIYHVQTPLNVKIPLYYCQRNIDTAFSL